MIFLVLSKLLRLPFSESFLDSGTVGAHLVRTLRYTLLLFVDLGLYPMLFRYMRFARRGGRKGAAAENGSAAV